ncbi:MAG: ATP-dependent RNA helicase HrpA [Thermodesulfobacteriota bacterium]
MKINYPDSLPVVNHLAEIVEAIDSHQVVVISGETGSGKTTQLPKICLQMDPDSDLLIGCSQPRRVAATSVSARVDEELGGDSGLVGYKIRFQDKTNKNTRIKFMTDGVLLAETKNDPLLKRYRVIIIDEAHERSLNIDFLLGYLKQLLPKRPDLKLIVTSATIDTEIFSRHFNDAPVISVSGRTYPVEVDYVPPEESETDDSEGYVEHCATVVCDLFASSPPRDTLIFLPTEKDIRQCCRLLENQLEHFLILPMFGRLQSADQQRIFKASSKPKIVVATNVAETSITVPGIRYVVDSGLARISQYNVRAKTVGLPVTRISRASCDQRAGRCGRVGPGHCIRLFSEDDYNNRSRFTLPEIKRSNLADVILQMVSFNLGNPEEFPFVEPPQKNIINDGYRLLRELGAIDEGGSLTETGRTMSRLPIDPCIARIIIAARQHNCLREIKIIASAIAIQDPRVRPADKEKAADTAHQEFSHPHSDFLVLLNIWNRFHSTRGRRNSWSQLKKFCKRHYLSFQRMREWLDLHEQLDRLLKRLDGFAENRQEASYADIHMALCYGFLRNIGSQKQKKDKIYQGPRGRECMIFPGSHQFHQGGKWIVAASFIETNRLYALTVAKVEPQWIEAAAGSLLKRSWTNPRYMKKSGQVVADETVSLFGLVLSANRVVNFGRSAHGNRKEAREIFIMTALVDGELHGRYDFLEKNIGLVLKWQEAEERLRRRNLLGDSRLLADFYDKRLPPSVYDRFTLNRFLKSKKSYTFLEMTDEDILLRRPEDHELADFPEKIIVGNSEFRLSYQLDPGSSRDGVTVHIPLHMVDGLSPAPFEWLVPGLIAEKITFLLKGLPKSLRKQFIPISNTVDLVLDDMVMYRGSMLQQLERALMKIHGRSVGLSQWPRKLPSHLEMNFSIHNAEGHELSCTKSLHGALTAVDEKRSHKGAIDFENAAQKLLGPWKEKWISSWDFEGLPDRFEVKGKDGTVGGYLYPALIIHRNRGAVTIELLKNREEALENNREGIAFLYQLQVGREFKTLKKHITTTLSGPSSFWFFQGFGNKATAVEQLLIFILQEIFEVGDGTIPSKEEFDSVSSQMKSAPFFHEGRKRYETIHQLLIQRLATEAQIRRFGELARKSRTFNSETFGEYNKLLESLLPHDFLEYDPERLRHTHLFMKALAIRVERAHASPDKDRRKASELAPHLTRFELLKRRFESPAPPCQELLNRYDLMIESYRLMLFAPELKPPVPVSAKKLKIAADEIERDCY